MRKETKKKRLKGTASGPHPIGSYPTRSPPWLAQFSGWLSEAWTCRLYTPNRLVSSGYTVYTQHKEQCCSKYSEFCEDRVWKNVATNNNPALRSIWNYMYKKPSKWYARHPWTCHLTTVLTFIIQLVLSEAPGFLSCSIYEVPHSEWLRGYWLESVVEFYSPGYLCEGDLTELQRVSMPIDVPLLPFLLWRFISSIDL